MDSPFLTKTSLISSDLTWRQIKNSKKKEKVPDININISDLTIIFLYTTLNKWFDKYKTMQKDYNEIKKYKER